MFPKIYNDSGDLLGILDNIIKDSSSILRVINGEFTFTFQAYEKELKSEYFDTDNKIIVNNQTFDIAYIEQMHEIEVSYSIECEHVSYRLIENPYTTYAFTGTPTEILTDILSGTDFSVGTVEFTSPTTISVNKEVTRRELIKQFAAVLGAEIDYSDDGFTIDLLDTLGQDNGYEIRFGKNLKGITKTIDKRGGLKTYYGVDIIQLKNSNDYISKGLQDLEIIELGDTVHIVDEVIGLDILNRIISITYDPVFEMNTTLEMTNTIELITDKITEIETSTIHEGALYNNVSISAEDGFVSQRSDNKARAVVNATDGIFIDSDTGSGLTKNFYVDTNGKIQAKELVIDGSGEFKGSITAGTIDIGANFLVDASGNMIANNAEFDGDITSSDITGSIFTGGTFRTATNGQRIEITGDDFNTYNSSNQKEGVQIESADDYNTLEFYEGGSSKMLFGYSTGLGLVGSSTEAIFLTAVGDLQLDSNDDILIDADDDIVLDNVTTNITMDRGMSDITISADEVQMTLSNDWDAKVNGQSLIFNESTQQISLQIFSGELEVFDGGVYQFTCSTKP